MFIGLMRCLEYDLSGIFFFWILGLLYVVFNVVKDIILYLVFVFNWNFIGILFIRIVFFYLFIVREFIFFMVLINSFDLFLELVLLFMWSVWSLCGFGFIGLNFLYVVDDKYIEGKWCFLLYFV